MSKKKRRQPESKVKKELAVEKNLPQTSRRWVWLVVGLLVVLLVIAGYFWFGNSSNLLTKRTPRPVGNVTQCQKVPPFVGQVGFQKMPALSTSEKSRPGLWLIEAGANGRKYQHPSWKTAGFLAPIERDREGNIFVAPAPFINILQNPPQEQNTVWRIDGKTQEMTKFVELPNDAELGPQNAFGALDIGYDCETESLYVSSVFGSTRESEKGKIYRIDLKTQKIASKIENIDGFGLGVFNSTKGKKLYFGLARKSEIWSVDLDDKGDFASSPKPEVSLVNLGPRGDDKARRINFSNSEMQVFGIEFNFNLIAPTEKQETVYRFRYDARNDKWEQIQDPPQIVQ
jgi:hypothetical protein